jgi:hypothetical protein
MLEGTQNLAQASAADVSQEHHESLSRQEAIALFEALCFRLGAVSPADIVQLFCARISYHKVIDWRRGHHKIPLWAWEYLSAMLDARADADKAMAARGRKAPAMAPGRGSHNNIDAWNARRAKEKAAPKDGP